VTVALLVSTAAAQLAGVRLYTANFAALQVPNSLFAMAAD
jgi:hypothetical protein